MNPFLRLTIFQKEEEENYDKQGYYHSSGCSTF